MLGLRPVRGAVTSVSPLGVVNGVAGSQGTAVAPAKPVAVNWASVTYSKRQALTSKAGSALAGRLTLPVAVAEVEKTWEAATVPGKVGGSTARVVKEG